MEGPSCGCISALSVDANGMGFGRKVLTDYCGRCQLLTWWLKHSHAICEFRPPHVGMEQYSWQLSQVILAFLEAREDVGRGQAAQREDPSTVWANFQCMQIMGQCQMGHYSVLVNGRPHRGSKFNGIDCCIAAPLRPIDGGKRRRRDSIDVSRACLVMVCSVRA
jgi:hypothetical protein